MTATHQARWLEHEPTGAKLTWRNAIFFPWDPEARLFKGEMVYTDLSFRLRSTREPRRPPHPHGNHPQGHPRCPDDTLSAIVPLGAVSCRSVTSARARRISQHGCACRPRQRQGSRSAPVDLDLVFLGTSASAPTASRGASATLLRRGGDRLLVDCGEGTQRQLLRSDAGLVDLEDVFLTHLHADHVLGLPGMLKTFALRGREAADHRLRPARDAPR